MQGDLFNLHLRIHMHKLRQCGHVIFNYGLFIYYVRRERGWGGVWQMLTIADEGAEGGPGTPDFG